MSNETDFLHQPFWTTERDHASQEKGMSTEFFDVTSVDDEVVMVEDITPTKTIEPLKGVASEIWCSLRGSNTVTAREKDLRKHDGRFFCECLRVCHRRYQ